MNLTSLLKIIKHYALNVPYLNTFSFGSVSMNWNNHQIKYNALNVALDSVDVNEEVIRYSFYVYFGDRLTNSKSNYTKIVDAGIVAIENIINSLRNTYDDIQIEKNYNYIPFKDKFADDLAGVYINIRVEVPNIIGLCDNFFDKEEFESLMDVNENELYDLENERLLAKKTN